MKKCFKKSLIIILAIVICFLPYNIGAINIAAIANESFITYKLHHKFHNVAATSKAVKCIIDYDPVKDQINAVTTTADVTTFDSGNGNLDSHAMEVVEALKYPSITFKSTSILTSGDMMNVTGILSFHGVSQEISFKAEMVRSGNKIQVSGKFPLSLEAYKVDRPSLMFVKLDDKMEMSFHTSFTTPEKI